MNLYEKQDTFNSHRQLTSLNIILHSHLPLQHFNQVSMIQRQPENQINFLAATTAQLRAPFPLLIPLSMPSCFTGYKN